MDFKTLINKMLNQYLVIYAGTMLGTLFFCMIFAPESVFSLDYFMWMLLFSLIGDLPFLVFYSKKELTEKQMTVRQAVHIVLLEAALLIAARKLGMYQGILEGIVFAVIVFAVYILVRYINFRKDMGIAEELNNGLKQRRKENGNGE